MFQVPYSKEEGFKTVVEEYHGYGEEYNVRKGKEEAMSPSL